MALIAILTVADVDAATLQVAYSDGRLSVTADGAPLSEVLRAVARQAGFRIDGLDTMSEPVTISLASVPLREALGQLLVTQDYFLIEEQMGPGPNSPTSVHVFGRKRRDAGATSPASAVEVRTGGDRPGAPSAGGGPAGAGEVRLSVEEEVRRSEGEELRQSAQEESRLLSDEETRRSGKEKVTTTVEDGRIP